MRIGVYGLGRFGSFWAGLCTNIGTVYAFNRSDRPTPEGVVRVDISDLSSCDAIFLCCAISSIPEVCASLAPILKPGTIVLDTCSVKMWPVQQMVTAFPKDTHIIGTHPMFGPDSARNGIAGLPMVFCPVHAPDHEFNHWVSLFSNLGLRTIVMTPDQHDHEAARTQGVTHFMGRLFAELGLKPSEISTLGYSRLQEVMEQTCNDPWQLFVDLQHYNPHTIAMREDIKVALERLTKRLTDNSPR